MQVGDLIKMKGPKSQYSWRPGYGDGYGIILEAAHRTQRTMRGCTVMWSAGDIMDVPEDFLEAIDESR